jgi:predicted small lipoprotein YifL
MKKLVATTLFISMLLVALLGCAGSGPSPEQQARAADQQREAERQQADFRKSLPPVSNPGQGW